MISKEYEWGVVVLDMMGGRFVFMLKEFGNRRIDVVGMKIFNWYWVGEVGVDREDWRCCGCEKVYGRYRFRLMVLIGRNMVGWCDRDINIDF